MSGTVTIAQAGPYPCTSPMTATPVTATLIGYARCSTDRQDLDAQHQALQELGVAEDRIYTYRGLTGTTRARPGLDHALAAVRQGDTLIVPKLDRLARSVPNARAIADQLQERGVNLALGRALYDPDDHMGKMFFNILATFSAPYWNRPRSGRHPGRYSPGPPGDGPSAPRRRRRPRPAAGDSPADQCSRNGGLPPLPGRRSRRWWSPGRWSRSRRQARRQRPRRGPAVPG